MCGFIVNFHSTLPNVSKVKADATAALAEAEKAEESLEKKVTEWGNLNLKWLRRFIRCNGWLRRAEEG